MTENNLKSTLSSQLEKSENERLRLQKAADKLMPSYILVPIVFIGCLFLFDKLLPTFLFTAILVGMFYGIYYIVIQEPFDKIVSKIRNSLLDEYMQTYHPLVEYKYTRGGNEAKDIIENTNLIKSNNYKEEDVVKGTLNKIEFYLSEIYLKREFETLEFPLFKGILFKIKLPKKDFPFTNIQSKMGLIKRNFGGLTKNDKYQFWIVSDDIPKIDKELHSIYPFFKHLMKNGRDVRIFAEKDEIVLLMESDVNFMDEPKFEIKRSFMEKEYYQNMTKHLNSFLFIIESLASGKDGEEIEKQLELNILEYVTKTEKH